MMRASFSHGRADAKHGRCSGRAGTPAAERPDERLSGGAQRRPLQPQGSAPEATGFQAALSLDVAHESPVVH